MKTKKTISIALAVSAFALTCQAGAAAQDFIYLMPSKEIFETGEDIWFKAYLMDIYPWRLWTINGELRPRVTTWSVPLLKRKR